MFCESKQREVKRAMDSEVFLNEVFLIYYK